MTRTITIVGGGLCGLSLGLGLRRRGVPVILHEAGSYPRHRVCGEFISGVSPEVLESLDIETAMDPSVIERSTAWFVRGRRVFDAVLPEPARGISRWHLDRALEQKFRECGGILKEKSRLTSGGEPGQVWCAGRMPAAGSWVGLKCHVRGLRLEANLELHLGRNGYVGLAEVEEGMVNVCGLFRIDRSLTGEHVLEKYLRAGGLGCVAGRISSARVESGSRAAVAGFQLGRQRRDDERMALGDAWAMIPPFTGNGMSMAFESAQLAVDPLSDFAEGRRDWECTRLGVEKALRKRFSRRLLVGGFLHPGLTSSVGQSFLAAMIRSGLFPFSLCFRLLR